MKIGKLEILRSKGCAWRVMYFYWLNVCVFHIGIDPRADLGKLEFVGGIRGAKDCTGGRKAMLLQWRFPVIKATYKRNMGAMRRTYYRLAGKLMHGLDGRYGWKCLRNNSQMEKGDAVGAAQWRD